MPCITLREDTKWVETVEDGWNVLVGANDDAIIKMANGFEPEGEEGGWEMYLVMERRAKKLRR